METAKEMKTESVDPWVRDEKLSTLRSWIDSGKTPPKEDLFFLLNQIEELDGKLAQSKEANAALLAGLEKQKAQLAGALHALTLWLAFRGSLIDDATLKATAPVAAHSVKVLNG